MFCFFNVPYFDPHFRFCSGKALRKKYDIVLIIFDHTDLDSSLIRSVEFQDSAPEHVSSEQISSRGQNCWGFTWNSNLSITVVGIEFSLLPRTVPPWQAWAYFCKKTESTFKCIAYSNVSVFISTGTNMCSMYFWNMYKNVSTSFSPL